MIKKINSSLILLLSSSIVVGCGAGGSSSNTTNNQDVQTYRSSVNNSSLQVVATNCRNMKPNTSCAIVLTYSSSEGYLLGFPTNLLPQFTLTTSTNTPPSTCPTPSINPITCNLKLNYSSGGGSQTLQSFTLGPNIILNQVQVSGQ